MSRCRHRCKCRCPKFVPFYPLPCGELLAFTFEAAATPASYSAAGTVIQLTYSITNTGTRYLKGGLRIAEAFLGTQYIQGLCLAPRSTVTYTNSYQITAGDLARDSLTFSPVALVCVCEDVYLSVPASVTVERV